VADSPTCQRGPTPRVRRAPIPDEAVLVVRGDELDPDVLTADAQRFHRRFKAWGRYGVSAFLATDDAEVDALCETRLRQWVLAVVFTRSALEARGIDVVPTFRTPPVTLAHPELPALVRGLTPCEHRVVVNPYHEPDIGPLETP
jgi:hypothetical protein